MSKRDPQLDHPAVRIYRDACRLTPNHIQRREIIVTIEWAVEEMGYSVDRALVTWKAVCEKFRLEGNNPKRVDWIMDRFEERVRGPRG